MRTGTSESPALPLRLPVDEATAVQDSDVIIVGAGAAGMTAALQLDAAGRHVTVITKDKLGDGSTAWAQGGLAAVLDPADSDASHRDDTLTAGAGLCSAAVVSDLASKAPDTIRRLIELGAVFDHDRDGMPVLGLEGGHSRRRIVHAGGDATGAEISRALGIRVAERRRQGFLEVLEQTTAVDAIRDDDGSVAGLTVLDGSGRRVDLRAPAVVLASGGIGQAWHTTTNPATATGDGIGIALRAGAVIQDAEFVQFHPTVLAVPESYRRSGDRGVLISEAVRGEGARLIDRDGNSIMAGRHPRADLAPRDVVAAAMHAHLLDSGEDQLYLDATLLGAQVWHERFSSILALCRGRGVDPVSEPIPVRPAAHYACGGVLATLDGVTPVPGLYAIGETAATGVHGANRLASNSLTEALISGERLGRRLSAGEESGGVGHLPGQEPEPVERPGLADDPGTATSPSPASTSRPKAADLLERARTMRGDPGGPAPRSTDPGHLGEYQRLDDHDARRRTTWAIPAAERDPIVTAIGHGAGVLREETGLSVLLKTLADVPVDQRPASRADIEATNIYSIGVLVGASALARTESRGCHRRADHPHPVPEWQRHSALWLGPDGTLTTTRR